SAWSCPKTAARFSTLRDFELTFDFDGRVGGQGGDTDGTARVPALVAERLHHQVGGAVHDLGPVGKAGRRIDEAAETDHANDLVEVAKRGLDLRQQVDGAGARGLLS